MCGPVLEAKQEMLPSRDEGHRAHGDTRTCMSSTKSAQIHTRKHTHASAPAAPLAASAS